MKKRISLVINTKNEEENIAYCINSAKNLVDEIIVIDMSSTDKTVLIAKKMGAKVFQVKDYGYVEPARNFALGKTSYEWILILDADERITPFLADKIRKIVDEDYYDVVKIPIKTIIFNKWIKHSGWWPVNIIRLFKKGSVSWSDKIHAQPRFKGRLFELPFLEKNSIIHYNYLSVDQLIKQIDEYTSKENNLKSTNISAEKAISYFESEFIRRYFQHRGFLDGLHGFFLSKFMEYYKFIELAKFWERNGFRQIIKPKVIHNYFQKKYKTNFLRLKNRK